MKLTPGLTRVLLRPLMVIGGLMLVAALGFRGSPRILTMIMLLPLGIGVILAFLRWPALGIIVASLSGLVAHYLGPSGLNATMILLTLVLGLWLFTMIARNGQLRLVTSRTMTPLFAFGLTAAVSFGFGQLSWLNFAFHAPLGAQLGGMSIVVLSCAAFLLVANQINELGWLRRMTWAFLAVGAMSFLARSVLPVIGLPTGDLFPQVGTMFFVWLVAMAFSQALFNEELHRIWRAGLALGAAGALAFFLMWARIVSTDEYSITTRFDAWVIMAQIIKISPILGLGFANYYSYTPLFPIRGYAVSFNSHNNYIDILAQMGLVGLVCLLWLWWEIGSLGWRLRTEAPAGFARAYVYGTLGGLAGMIVSGMLGDWFLPFFYNIGLNGFRSSALSWFILGGLVSIEQLVIGRRLSVAQK